MARRRHTQGDAIQLHNTVPQPDCIIVLTQNTWLYSYLVKTVCVYFPVFEKNHLWQCAGLACLVAHGGGVTGCDFVVAGGLVGQSGSSAMVNMVELDNLTVSYRQHPALHHISGGFARGSLTAVVGPNGSGKSTLLKSIMGLLPLSSGKLTVSGPASRIAYLPQVAEIERNFPINVHDCVCLGCWSLKRAWGGMGGEQLQRVDAALEEVGLQGFAHRPISSLSSGQLQRVLFARLLVQNAEVMLLDEPFNAIDSKTTAALLRIIARWHEKKHTVLVVLHDDAQVRQFFPQTLLLARELVAWGPTHEVMTSANLATARAMAEAWEDNAELCELDAVPSSSHTDLHTASHTALHRHGA